MRFKATVLTTAALLVLSAATQATTTEEVLKKFMDKQAQVKTMECDLKFAITDEDGENQSITLHLATQTMFDGGKAVGRKMLVTPKEMPGMKIKMVNDGKFLWSEMSRPGSDMVLVVKENPGAEKLNSAPTHRFTELFDLKLKGEDTLDGSKVWVLEGKSKNTESGPTGSATLTAYVDQKDYLCRRYVVSQEEGLSGDCRLEDLKIDGKVDEALFKYTPPAGARIIDQTAPRMR